MSKKPLIFVLGLGKSGLAAIQYALDFGCEVHVWDDDAKRLQNSRPLALQPTDFSAYAFFVLSPGISRKHPLVQKALQAGIPVYTELDLAADYLKSSFVVGVTGTNGKSSTTALLGDIFLASQKPVFAGGNLGVPLCEYAHAHPHEAPAYAVIELSSYQLESLQKIQLDVAIITNLTPDHLDRYDSVENYYQTKLNICSFLKPSGVLILNAKDESLRAFAKQYTKHPILWFDSETYTFNTSILFAKHHFENAMAAILAAQKAGLTQEQIQEGVARHKGLPHRLEYVGEIKGVRFYNDSKSTTVESTLAALSCFLEKEPIHLILGGLGKGASYQPLVEACKHRNIQSIYTLGQDAPKIEEAFADFSVFSGQYLQNALSAAFENAKEGDLILLSPACASLDQFDNYAHRGDEFKKLFWKFQNVSN